MNKTSLRVAVFPGRAPAPKKNEQEYQSAFSTWKLVWKQALLELDGSDHLDSDHFTRQDYIVALYFGELCVGLTCFRRAVLSRESDCEDSWFKPWPKARLGSIGQEYSEGLVVSWVTIHPDFRKSQSDEKLRQLNVSLRLSECINLFLQDCGLEVAFGVTRNNRSVNRFCEYAGSISVQKNAIHHGVDVDLILWTPESVRKAQSQFPTEPFELWEDRKVYFDQHLKVSPNENKRRLRIA